LTYFITFAILPDDQQEGKSMTTTRDRILQTLLRNPHSTIIDLAEEVGINGISVRHHLTSLQAEGLVTYQEERHGVGRPRLVYSLTENGLERFPSRYLRLTNLLLDQLKQSLPGPVVERLFTQMASEMASDYAQKVESFTIEEKLAFIKTFLASEGFEIEWERQGDHYLIHEMSCPYLHIGQAHPEVCTMDRTIISTVLSIPTSKIQCILNGDAHCTFSIPIAPPQEDN
jgi:predicted ArsR family transcriptional regulator